MDQGRTVTLRSFKVTALQIGNVRVVVMNGQVWWFGPTGDEW